VGERERSIRRLRDLTLLLHLASFVCLYVCMFLGFHIDGPLGSWWSSSSSSSSRGLDLLLLLGRSSNDSFVVAAAADLVIVVVVVIISGLLKG
jgi:hypothetical protein